MGAREEGSSRALSTAYTARSAVLLFPCAGAESPAAQEHRFVESQYPGARTIRGSSAILFKPTALRSAPAIFDRKSTGFTTWGATFLSWCKVGSTGSFGWRIQ